VRAQLFFAASLALTIASPSFADTWKFDPAHSDASFSVRHLMISNVKGEFSKVSGIVDYDPKQPENAKVEATIDVTTVDTREPKRDDHLRSADFFDVQKYPTMTFKSTKVVPAGKEKLKVTGDLTMHGVTKEVVLDVAGPSATIKDNHGNEKSGVSASTTINRKDFGMTWNKAMDNGGVMLGDEIPITIEVEMSKQPKVAEAK
jgi:polyisoprenoid-binding protein YceI